MTSIYWTMSTRLSEMRPSTTLPAHAGRERSSIFSPSVWRFDGPMRAHHQILSHSPLHSLFHTFHVSLDSISTLSTGWRLGYIFHLFLCFYSIPLVVAHPWHKEPSSLVTESELATPSWCTCLSLIRCGIRKMQCLREDRHKSSASLRFFALAPSSFALASGWALLALSQIFLG
jgi:hypothetical protein